MKTPSTKQPPTDFQDSTQLLQASRSLRVLVKEAAARLKQARAESQAARIAHGFGKGNGEKFHGSRY